MSPEEQPEQKTDDNETVQSAQSHQEPIQQPQAQPQSVPQQSIDAQVDAGHGLGIASLVAAFFVGIVGIILGIIGLIKSKKTGHKNGLAIAGIVIGAIQTVVAIAFIIISIFSAWYIINDNSHGSYNNGNINDDSQVADNSSQALYSAMIDGENVAFNNEVVDESMGTGMALYYPDGWSVEKYNNDNQQSDAGYIKFHNGFSITSPDEEATVDFFFYYPELGVRQGSCQVGEEYEVYDFDSIEGYPGLGFVAYYRQLASNSYFYIGTYDANYSINKIGNTQCDSGIVDQPYEITLDNGDSTYFTAYIGYKSVVSNAQTESFIKTEDYKIAKEIIRSLHIKE